MMAAGEQILYPLEQQRSTDDDHLSRHPTQWGFYPCTFFPSWSEPDRGPLEASSSYPGCVHSH